jgi:hypothetical protein
MLWYIIILHLKNSENKTEAYASNAKNFSQTYS